MGQTETSVATPPTSALRTWADMIKFAHSIFALPFALVATFWAGRARPGGWPSAGQVGLIVLCMVAARSFAMTFNRIVDAAIDARNPRTASRPLPAGTIRRGQAWAFLVGSAALFLLGCGGFVWLDGNRWPIRLAIPTLVVLAGYSYCKRFTALAHFVLGAVIAFAPTAAWIAISPATLGLPAALLTGAVLFWIAGFDLIYACQDVEVDRREGLFSVPARLGVPAALWLSRGCHVATVGLLVGLGAAMHVGGLYWLACGLTALLLAGEQSVVRPHDLSRVNLDFFTLNGCVSVVFAILAIADGLLH